MKYAKEMCNDKANLFIMALKEQVEKNDFQAFESNLADIFYNVFQMGVLSGKQEALESSILLLKKEMESPKRLNEMYDSFVTKNISNQQEDN